MDYLDLSFFPQLSDPDNPLYVDGTFLNEEKTISEKEKYGLAQNEKIGLVINGEIKGDSQNKYTTVLTSDRFLMFCWYKRCDIKWAEISSVSRSGESIVFKLTDGTEQIFHGGFLGEGIGKTNSAINKIDYLISLIKNKIP